MYEKQPEMRQNLEDYAAILNFKRIKSLMIEESHNNQNLKKTTFNGEGVDFCSDSFPYHSIIPNVSYKCLNCTHNLAKQVDVLNHKIYPMNSFIHSFFCT